jgi:DNA-binding NarL/FixJ family response regulator
MTLQPPRHDRGFDLPHRPGVLIVEDELLIAINNAGVVDDIGCDVVGIAATAADALAIAEQRRPDLAIVDITLGDGMDGVELARRLIARHGMRVIFASAQHDERTRHRADLVGPAGFLRKPFPDRALQDLVRRSLAPEMLLCRDAAAHELALAV